MVGARTVVRRAVVRRGFMRRVVWGIIVAAGSTASEPVRNDRVRRRWHVEGVREVVKCRPRCEAHL